MNNSIPSGWVESSLEPYCEKITDGAHLSPPTSSEGFPIATVENMRARHIDIQSCRTISKSDFESLQRNSCAPEFGDVLFSKDGTIGKTFVFLQKVEIVLLSSIAIIRTKKAKLVPEFLTQYLKSPFFFRSIEHATSGSAIRRVVLKDIKTLPINLPPVSEQQKIASILTAVDEVIESTTAQINKLKDLKTGMMQELLTKGIGHTEFKDSPVGRIPKAWDCCLLDKVARRGSGHTPDKQTHEYWNGGVKWISLTDSSKLDRLYIGQTENNISELGILNSSAVLHPKGTVVMTRDAGIGKSAITTDQMAVSQHFMAWICGDRLHNHFLYYLLQLWKPRFENIAIGSTIKTIGLQYFKTLEIPVPPIYEQEKIATSLLSLDNSIFRIEMKRANLLDLKKALMQDLLTGKVRVRAM